MDNASPGLSFIVPAYNEEGGIADTLERLGRVLSDIDLETEIILVDDGSSDHTHEIASTVDGVRVLRHPINSGYGRSIKTGMKNARFDWFGIVDADGTYEIEKIPDLVAEMEKGFDMVVAHRSNVLELDSGVKRFFRRVFIKFISVLLNYEVRDPNSGFRIFRRELAEYYTPFLSNAFSFTTSLTLFLIGEGCFVSYIKIEYKSRTGKSKVRHFRDSLRTIQLVIQGIAISNPIKSCILISILFSLLILFPGIILFYFDHHFISAFYIIFGIISFFIILFGLLVDILRVFLSMGRPVRRR